MTIASDVTWTSLAALADHSYGELLTAMGLNPLHGARIDEIEALSCARAAEVLKREGLAERLRVAA